MKKPCFILLVLSLFLSSCSIFTWDEWPDGVKESGLVGAWEKNRSEGLGYWNKSVLTFNSNSTGNSVKNNYFSDEILSTRRSKFTWSVVDDKISFVASEGDTNFISHSLFYHIEGNRKLYTYRDETNIGKPFSKK